MNIENMTDEQKRVRIAEACGFNPDKFTEGDFGLMQVGDNGLCQAWVPDYLFDLNAMHEAEKCLTKRQQSVYLSFLTLKDQAMLTNTFWPAVHATARNRADAFLLTLPDSGKT